MKLTNNKAHFWINAFRNLSVSGVSLCLGEGSTLVTRYLYDHMSHCVATVNPRTVSEGTHTERERDGEKEGE